MLQTQGCGDGGVPLGAGGGGGGAIPHHFSRPQFRKVFSLSILVDAPFILKSTFGYSSLFDQF